MNRKLFLEQLEELWREDSEYGVELTIEDLLDDAATIGLEGASDVYLKLTPGDIDPNTGSAA